MRRWTVLRGALPNREAFCMRDVSHQCVGGEVLGLHRQ
jgi:hypothetical protein